MTTIEITTQNEAYRKVSEASCVGEYLARVTPREPISLESIPVEMCGECESMVTWNAFSSHIRCECCTEGAEPLANHRLVGVTVVGGSEAMHPDWVRTIRNECVSNEVPFCFESWGEYAPHKELPPMQPGESRSFKIVKPDGKDRIFNVNGTFSGDSPTSIDEWMSRVGKEKSGRTLDGQVWDQHVAELTP